MDEENLENELPEVGVYSGDSESEQIWKMTRETATAKYNPCGLDLYRP